MRILLINKFHYLKGGGERSYFDTARALAEHGHDLAFFSMSHPQNRPSRWSEFFAPRVEYDDSNLGPFQKIKAAFNIFYNFSAKRKIKKLIRVFKPDVAHLHNIYRQLSPSIIDGLKEEGVPIVMTLHDYGLVSPARTLSVRGRIWEKDKPNKHYKCLPDKCVKNSYLKSAVAVAEIYFHKLIKIYYKISVFVSPSEFLIAKFGEYGFKRKIIHLPHFVEARKNIRENIKNEKNENYILYYGRLSEEKGVGDLLEAYSRAKTDCCLKIAGDGPEKNKLKKIAGQSPKKNKIDFLGFCRDEKLWDLVDNARLIVFPARCYENSPYSLLESMAAGKAVLAPKVGGYIEAIADGQDGYFYKFGDINDFSQKIDCALKSDDQREKIGKKAREKIKKINNKEKYYQELIKIYQALTRKNGLK